MSLSMLGSLRKRFSKGGILGTVPEWLTVNEAAAYLKVHRATIYELCERGTLPFFEIRGARGRRFKREDLDALLERGVPREGTDDGSGRDKR